VPNFRSLEDIKRWLAGKHHEAMVAFAARAALRAVPHVITWALDERARLRKAEGQSVLRTFRGADAAWANAAYPGERVLRKAFIKVTDGESGRAAQHAAECASAAAAFGETEANVRDLTEQSVRFAIEACGAEDARALADTFKAYCSDAEKLDNGISPVTVANSQLWPAVSEKWPLEPWRRLKPALLAAQEDWDVWTGWYENRLRGEGTDRLLELMRAALTNEMWQKGPPIVNAEIKRFPKSRSVFEEIASAPIWRRGWQQPL
jgi:hypothetical protein